VTASGFSQNKGSFLSVAAAADNQGAGQRDQAGIHDGKAKLHGGFNSMSTWF
jgi:hypothetical protein